MAGLPIMKRATPRRDRGKRLSASRRQTQIDSLDPLNKSSKSRPHVVQGNGRRDARD